MAKKDFLEEKYCEINQLKTLLQAYPKEYCSTIIKVMDSVFNEIAEYLNGTSKGYDKVEKKVEVKKVVKKEEVPQAKVIEEKVCEEKPVDVEKIDIEKLELEKLELEEKLKKCEEKLCKCEKQAKKCEKEAKKCGKKLKKCAKGKSKSGSSHGKHKCCGKRCEEADENQIFTMQELSKYNGRDGVPAYVAVNGIVYDVTGVEAWKYARHYGLTAGKDLSNYFNSCHKNEEKLLDKLDIVGRFEE